MTDIVKRLREDEACNALSDEAAEEIERLRQAAQYACVMIDHFIHGEHGQDGLVAGYDRLRAALSPEERA